MSIKRQSLVRTVIITLASALVLAGCAGESDTGTDATPLGSGTPDCEGETIKIGMSSSSFIYFPFFVTLGSNALEDTGLSVEEVELGGGSEAVTATVSGSVDVSISTFSTVIRAAGEGAEIVAFAPAEVSEGLGIMARASDLNDAGIDQNSSAQDKLAFLRGKSIAISSPGSGSDTLLRYLLKEGGIDAEEDVTITAAGSSSAMASAFIAEQVDVISGVSPPTLQVAESEGGGELLFFGPAGDIPGRSSTLFTSFNTGRSTLEERPEILRCFAYALRQGMEMIHDDPEAAADAAYPYFEETLEVVGGRAAYDESFDSYAGTFAESPVIDEEQVKTEIEYVGATGDVNFEGLVDTSIAESLNQ